MERVEARVSRHPLRRVHQSLNNSVLKVVTEAQGKQSPIDSEVVQPEDAINPSTLFRSPFNGLIPSPGDPDFDAFYEYIGLDANLR